MGDSVVEKQLTESSTRFYYNEIRQN